MNKLRGETRLGLAEAADLLGVSQSSVRRWIYESRIPGCPGLRPEFYRIAGRWITSREAVERLLAAMQQRPQAVEAAASA